MANKRKYSRPNIERQLVVNSQSSIDACENFVNRTMSSLYALDVILYYIADGQVAEAANDEVKRIFDAKHDVFDQDVLKLSERVEACEADEAKYTEEFSRNYKIYSPLCASYLKLIMKFERCINLIDSLWFAGEVTSKSRTTQVMKLGRHLRNLSSQINNISRRAMEIARNEGKESEVTEAVKEIGAEEALAEAVIESKKNAKTVEKAEAEEEIVA
ncbi:hypothetical protein [Vibrio sp. 10N]|uniref:hypothetical protein n=1 Tax=Vibrio sp. 10N TaxID=3058938 RepID=UPI002813920C|nr:hypothetical protein VB10N_46630 [Vibrio sp. 10N]